MWWDAVAEQRGVLARCGCVCAGPAAAAAAHISMAPQGKTYSLEECKAHTTDKDCWLVIHGKVYDVTDFLEEHPGGYDIILTSAGKDATQDFEEIGHSNSARDLLEKYLIGAYAGGDSAPGSANAGPAAAKAAGGTSRIINILLPLLLILAAVFINLYLSAGKKQ